MVKECSFKNMGIDVGDQQLRNKVSHTDQICSTGWSRKWSVHGMQQFCHNAHVCWKDIHGFKTGNEERCKMWSDEGQSSSKILWAFQIGLMKGLLPCIKQCKHANKRLNSTVLDNAPAVLEHAHVMCCVFA